MRCSIPFYLLASLVLLFGAPLSAQVVINEASSRNFSTLADGDGDLEDWVELYNAGSSAVDLQGWTITDNINNPDKWTFPSVTIPAQGYLVVFCSGKDRSFVEGHTLVGSYPGFTPDFSWNTHPFSDPFAWDGSSNLLINVVCTREGDPTLNSVFSQMTTEIPSSNTINANDPQIYAAPHGTISYRRPLMRLNGITIGTQDWQNSVVQYPAPYSNWFSGAKHEFLLRAEELIDAGLTAGEINSLAFDVLTPNQGTYDALELRMAQVADTIISGAFHPMEDRFELHTNFKLSTEGETVHLFSPEQLLQSSLEVVQGAIDHSNGATTDGDGTDVLFATPTPGGSNNASPGLTGYALAPFITVPSSLSTTPLSVTILDINTGNSEVRYTLDGSDPTETSTLYTGPITVAETSNLKARAFKPGTLPSPSSTSSYLVGIAHTTAVLSVTTPTENLYGDEGIFTNWQFDTEIPAHADYFDTDGQLLFSQRTGMQVDGGAGGSRGFPQHSFRLELDNGVLGDGTVEQALIPDRMDRTEYSRVYLRNGSNQYLILPHKDAAQVKAMAGATNGYYAAWTPVTVYINGGYFGVYEMREKYDEEYFGTLENADPDSMELLTLSLWNGGALRPNVGSVDGFWQDVIAFNALDPAQFDFWEQADLHFDLIYYTDYIFGQMWMANVDWPANNIKAYRSNITDQRWRFCTIDMEIAMAPNGQTGPDFNGVQFVAGQDQTIPYTNIWQRSINNPRFHDYFINRAADIMNSAYRNERILGIAQEMYDLTRPEMGKHFLRWAGPDTTTRLIGFDANNNAFQNDLSQRTPIVRNHLQAHFDLPQQVDVTLEVHPAGAGTIRISTLQPDAYPWQGVYFDGVPVHIEAVPNEGYVFSHWASNELVNDTLNALFLDTLTTASTLFDAFFIEDFTTVLEPNVHDVRALTIHPNPATTELIVSGFGEQHYEVLDLRGSLLRSGTFAAGRHVGIAGLAAGVYQLRVHDQAGNRETLRFVKQ